jgi:hypothetical protein
MRLRLPLGLPAAPLAPPHDSAIALNPQNWVLIPDPVARHPIEPGGPSGINRNGSIS